MRARPLSAGIGRCVVFAALVLLLAVARPGADQATPSRTSSQSLTQPDRQFPQVTFKVEINYVEVDAVVVDQQGEFVSTLRQEDFQVIEDGQPQKVTTFGLVDIPVERAEAPLFQIRQPVEPDVQTNVRALDGRIYLIILDDNHTGPLRSLRVRKAAREFIERDLAANDLAAVVCTSGRAEASQDFTSNKRLLLAAIDKFMGQKLVSATLNKLDDYYMQRSMGSGDAPRDIDEQERVFRARNTLSSLRQAADFMAGVRGRRKALIFMSEGIDYDITDVIGNQGASTLIDESREAIAAATRANVSFYTVDPRGLTDMGDEGILMTGLPSDPSVGLGTQSMMNELRLSQDSLRVLADETGGFAVLNSNDFRTAFDRIRQDNSSYYILGYYPVNDRRDGRFRKIEVRVNRPGFSVRARRGYVAPRGKAPATAPVDAKGETTPALREALNSPIPVNGLRMSLFAAPFKGAAPNASVLIVMQADGRDLSFVEKDGRFVDGLEVSIIASDVQGKTKNGSRRIVTFALKPETHASISTAGIRLTDRLDLPPGRYQIRLAASDTNRRAVGSVHYDLEVPNFSSLPFSMSGLVVTSSQSAATPTANADEEMKKILPGPPTTGRTFSGDEELSLVTEIYDNQGATPHTVDILSTVRSDDGQVVFKHAEERASAEFQGARGGFGYATRIPLKGLAPGLYVLRVEARSRLGKDTVASRELQFRIQ
jgi:VWFA-related protein